MEGSPLTLAYTHARNAAQETKRANHVAASEEHDLAAAEFAAVAQQTTDKEALRILRLLEQHHKQLGYILKNVHLQPGPGEDKRNEFTSKSTPTSVAQTASLDPDRSIATSQPPRLARTARSTARDLSSSIASNLASARGIPGGKPRRTVAVSPLVSNEHTDGTFSQDADQKKDTPNRSQPPVPSWTPPSDVGVRTNSKSPSDNAGSDASFPQGWGIFEGLLSKFSAPLVFPSLPLSRQTSEIKSIGKAKDPTSPESSKMSTKSKISPPAVSPDYSQLISQAALRAVREPQETNYSKPHESFLLVPTSGGTMSYADITAQTHINRQLQQHSHGQGHTRNLSSTSDDFVDASSQILSAPRSAMQDRRASQVQKYAGKTMEELHLENQVLRKTTNEITKRLQIFESAAQTSSAALAQSIRSLHLSPVTTPQNSRGRNATAFADSAGANTGNGDAQMDARIRELEALLQKSQRKVSKRDEELLKYKLQVEKYEKKWQDLKAGAKARREREAANNIGGGNGDKTRRSSRESKAVEGDQAEGSVKADET